MKIPCRSWTTERPDQQKPLSNAPSRGSPQANSSEFHKASLVHDGSWGQGVQWGCWLISPPLAERFRMHAPIR